MHIQILVDFLCWLWVKFFHRIRGVREGTPPVAEDFILCLVFLIIIISLKKAGIIFVLLLPMFLKGQAALHSLGWLLRSGLVRIIKFLAHRDACLFWEMLVIQLRSQLVASVIYSCFLLGPVVRKDITLIWEKGRWYSLIILINYRKQNTVDKQRGGNRGRVLNVCTRTLFWIQKKRGGSWKTSKSMWKLCCCEGICLWIANNLGRLAANRRAKDGGMNGWEVAGNKCSLEVGILEPTEEQRFETVLYWQGWRLKPAYC